MGEGQENKKCMFHMQNVTIQEVKGVKFAYSNIIVYNESAEDRHTIHKLFVGWGGGLNFTSMHISIKL